MLFENDNRQRISCIWLYFLIIATIILLFSCSGVPQEHYDLVTAQLKAEKIRNDQLSKERDKFVVELEEENTRNDQLSKDLATTQSKVHDLENRLDDFQDKVDEALLSVGILNSFLELELVDDNSNLLELMARLGEIENEGPNGQGTLTSPDGDKYEGEFKDGVFHGKGTYTWSEGKFVG